MVKGAFDLILYPLGIETSAIVRCIPGSTKATLCKCLGRHLTQHGDVLFGCNFRAGRIVPGKGNGKVYLTFNQLKAVLLERVKQIGALRRDLSLHSLPGDKI